MHNRFDGTTFVTTLKVRDSECDAQGVVNNANYLVYMEYARHEFLEAQGVTFADLVRDQVYLMVAHLEIDFVNSLSGGQVFDVESTVSRKGAKAIFDQRIVRVSDKAVCIRARVEVIAKINGKLTRGEFFDRFMPK
ncbi:acyl-CoA thioesterase [Asticcacaulis sp. BYS171W]|uniref:Acyl-CoA thioesterase n=1 Tax=Asticcacaulis aquaticus TaxID=2984212 RepID=A0ABT5HSD0_9CAUL|nr:acyl-CoA thioesterase [Asticcacaulis aquaticus]MDC7682371.1 acyl-CoA thioesterase [Asticcacaulis aquaticus]